MLDWLNLLRLRLRSNSSHPNKELFDDGFAGLRLMVDGAWSFLQGNVIAFVFIEGG